MKRILIPLAIWFVLALTTSIFAQQPSAEEKRTARRDGSITGRVVTADGQPLSDAQIIATAVSGKLTDMQQSSCDEAGNFKLTGLRAGSYKIWATMPGYVSMNSMPDTELYRMGDYALLTLVKGGVITGRVTDAAGEPIAGVRVIPRMIRNQAGRPVSSFPKVTDLDSFGRLTDDRGIYRLFGLEAGVYVVSVNGSAIPDLASVNLPHDVVTFHPSATRDTATELTVSEGSELTGIDIRHRGLRGHIISGTLSGEVESDTMINGVAVLLKSATTGQVEAMTVTMGSRGFAFQSIADGEYDLVAVRINEKDDRATSQPRRVSVKGADATGIELKLLKLGVISGRVILEKSGQANACPSNENYSVEEITLRAASDNPRPNQSFSIAALIGGTDASMNAPNEKGEFTVLNLEPDSYRIEANLPGDNWFVRSMTLPPKGASKTRTDAARSPIPLKSGEKVSGLELALADGAAAVSGKIHSEKPLPSGLRVHLIPAEPAAADDVLRYRETASASDGSFQFKNLSPGKYWLLAKTESGEPKSHPAAYDAAERAQLRRAAESAKTEITLLRCQRENGVAVEFQSK